MSHNESHNWYLLCVFFIELNDAIDLLISIKKFVLNNFSKEQI